MSVNSLAELAFCLGGTPQAKRSVVEVINVELELPPEAKTRLLDSLAQRLSVGEYLQRRDLHRSCGVPYATLLSTFKRWAAGGAPSNLAEQLESLDNFLDLSKLVPARLGQQPLSSILGALRCSGHLRRKVLMSVGGSMTVSRFLATADELRWSDREFFDLLEAFIAWLADQTDPTPNRAVTADALRAQASQLGLRDLLLIPSVLLDPAGTYRSLEAMLGAGEVHTVAAILQRFTQRLEVARSQPEPSAPGPRSPALALVQQTALAERRKLAEWPWGLLRVRANLESDGVTLRFVLHAAGVYHPTVVTTGDAPFARWAAHPVLVCSCEGKRLPMCWHRIAVLEGLTHWVAEPEPAKVLSAALVQPWERLLSAIGADDLRPTPKAGVMSFRLQPDGVELRFHELGKRGPSSKGKSLSAGAVLERVEGVEQRIAERLALAEAERHLEPSRHVGDAVALLVGHPRVRWADDEAPAPAVLAGQVRAVVDERDDGYSLRLLIDDVECAQRDFFIYRATAGFCAAVRRADGAIVISALAPSLARALAVMERFGNTLPKEAAPRIVELLPKLEADAVVELPAQLQGEERPPRASPVVQVTTSGEGLALAVRVEPLEGGPVFVPGHGVPVSAAFDGHRRTFTRRNLEAELHEAQAIAGHLGLDPALAPSWSWLLDRSDKHVETLRRLTHVGVPVEWKAPRVKFTSEARLDRLKLEISRKKDWFGLDGEVTVDDRRVSLAALLEAARARRRFVRLDEGDFAQLSEAMLDALAPLAHLATPGQTPELTLGTAPLIETLAPQVAQLEAAKEWAALMARLASSKKATFAVPRGLKATLRDYQVEGFQWLSRLAEWGVGACLADDMGLGKTLQALALLLARAKKGPALVVAPSSVLHTWRVEAGKFAPGLRLVLFHESDRALGELSPGDVVVVSWTLLAREAEAFAKARFATVVFDEAHAIKNASTQRAKAAHGLDAEFVVALSGTPVENHVGELWSLFKAVMPALLGSEESFRRRFGAGDREALAALATVVRPFVLRRTKDAVAKELPPRTDLEVLVPLTAEERALYDDVRLAAVGELGEVTGDSKRFDVLAALTRLRLTACHPKLVDAGWKGPTSKLQRLLELVKDLVGAQHRVLVFSQFTSHLALVVEALRVEGLVFSYLDGQVPVAERQRRVERFQRGEGGDVFLVSLKAGGTGLTLTAADYVIHLDPWWNPAVEDQASDRAHRLGQTKPVTVYRLIAEGTIEQQILSLHRDKRELVDALLAGSDTAGKLTTTQLADLIRAS